MKVKILIAKDEHVVEWDKNIKDFPNLVTYKNNYYEWIMYDQDSNNCEYQLHFGKRRVESIPCDINGIPFPVPDLVSMFNLSIFRYDYEVKCECGAETVYGPNTGHSQWCPKWSPQ